MTVADLVAKWNSMPPNSGVMLCIANEDLASGDAIEPDPVAYDPGVQGVRRAMPYSPAAITRLRADVRKYGAVWLRREGPLWTHDPTIT